MTSIFRASVARMLGVIALMLTAITLSSGAEAGLRRPVVREIDLLTALIEADVPPEAWRRLDEPFDRYRAVVAERESAWAAQPRLDRRLERPEEIDGRRREQRRRNEHLLGDQRTLLAELRAALMEHVSESGEGAACVEHLTLLLEAHLASRTAVMARDGMIVQTPLPTSLAMRLSPSERRAVVAAMCPRLRPYITAAEAFFELHLGRAPGIPPMDEHHHMLPGFEAFFEEMDRRLDERRDAAVSLAQASGALHAAALACVAPERRDAVRAVMFEPLDLNSHFPQMGNSFRRLAPLAPHLDEGQRNRLMQASKEINEFLRREHEAALTRLLEFGPDDYGRVNMGDRFSARFREAEAAWNSAAREVLGDRYRPILRAVWSAEDAVEALRDLFDETALKESLAIDDANWQLRQIERRRASTARWRSLVDAGVPSERLRRNLPAIAGGEESRLAALVAAVDRHAERWTADVEPLQAQIRPLLDQFFAAGAEEDVLRPAGTLLGNFDALRNAIDEVERELTSELRGTGGDAFAVDRWILDRAMELFAPVDGHDRAILLPMVPVPQTIDEVIERAELASVERATALGTAFVRSDALIDALRRRQAELELQRLWWGRRNALFNAMIASRGSFDPNREASYGADLDALFRRLNMPADGARDAVVQAWEEILEDWRAALPEEGDRLRHAWLSGLVPQLDNEGLPVPALLERLRQGSSADARDESIAEALAFLRDAHRAERDHRKAEAAAFAARLPLSLKRWRIMTVNDFDFSNDPRNDFIRRFEDEDLAHAVRTLRRAIALRGVDESLAEPALVAALVRTYRDRPW